VTSEARTRPKRRLDAVRRPQILSTAVELVREKGLWSVRIADVAKRAGMSPTSVVYYFGTKDQLFADAITAADDAFYAPVRELLEGLDRASDRIAWLLVRSSVSDWLLWMDLWVYAQHHPEAAVTQRGFARRWRQAIEEIVRYGNQTGEWRADDPADVALRLGALTDGLAVHMVLGDPDHTRQRYVEMTLVAVSLELGVQLEVLRQAAARCPVNGDAG
jgi:AcrR family transcriptional regulator